jgi:predicted DNA-binding transcriptional regulator YafY
VAETTVHLSRRAIPAVSTDALMQLATACRRLERLRFDYTDAQDRPSVRHTEPYRVVCSDWQWYLVAYDLEREGWRTFRIDRMSQLVSTGVTFAARTDTPDAAAQVSAGLALYAWELQATVRLHTTLERARRMIDHDEGVLEPDGDSVLLRTGGEIEWLASFLAGLECDFDIIEPDELRHALRSHAEDLLRRAERGQATRASASPVVDTT